MTSPVRSSIDVFAEAVTVKVALPLPAFFESNIQDALAEAVHIWLEVIVSDLLPPSAVNSADVGVTLKVGAAPSCEILTV